jgi:predicted double-glycine peptidase
MRAGRLAALVASLSLCALALAQPARAPLVEAIDIEREGAAAHITVRFTRPASYLRHQSSMAGKALQITLDSDSAAGVEILRAPDTDMVPLSRVTYAPRDRVLQLDFREALSFTVAAGAEARSVRITVPVAAGAKDWMASARAPSTKADAPVAPDEAGATAESSHGAHVVGYAGGGNGAYAVPIRSLKQVRFEGVVHQGQDWSCGSAALATLLTYHYAHPITERRALEAMFARGDQARIRKEGFSLLDMKNFLDAIGFQANGFETSLDRLTKVGVPAIVVINDGGYNHFVVVKGLRHGNVLLGDPAKGVRSLPRADFEAMWENRIVFVITNRRDGVSFNTPADWRYMAAPLGDSVSRASLAGMLLFRPGPNDF